MHFTELKTVYFIQNAFESLLFPTAVIKCKERRKDKLSHMPEISFESVVLGFLCDWTQFVWQLSHVNK